MRKRTDGTAKPFLVSGAGGRVGYDILTDSSDVLESRKSSTHHSSTVIEACTKDQA